MSRSHAFTALAAGVLLSGLARPVAAHTGTTHAGTPHWLLLVVTLVGVAALAGGLRAVARGRRELGAAAVGAGSLLAAGGAVGLVEIQVQPQTAPAWGGWVAPLNVAVAGLLAVGSLAVVRLRWPTRLRYVGLAGVLAAWTAYPVVAPNGGLTNPLGYLVVLALPVAVAYVLARDAGDRLWAALSGRARLVAAGAFLVFGGFFAVSAGTFTLNPDTGPGLDGGFVTLQAVASPLVYWPAVEFYAPSVPAAGYVSVGSLLLLSVLGGLVALNAGLVARGWAGAAADADSTRALVGAVAASGATACCCCAPALYGVVGAALGTAASPVYWAFLDPASPVGGLFLSASVLLLTGSAVRSARATVPG